MITIGEFFSTMRTKQRLSFQLNSAESAFKALALAIKEAVSRTGLDDIPSTKGEIQTLSLSFPPSDSLFYLQASSESNRLLCSYIYVLQCECVGYKWLCLT